jgi:hypothetical protein
LSKKKAPELQLEGKNRTTNQQGEGSVMGKHNDVGAGVNQAEKVQMIEHPLSVEMLWVSVVGTCGRFDESADRWHVSIRRRGNAMTLQSFVVTAPDGGLISLDALDIYLLERGWTRHSAWEMGSDDGWVAWLAPRQGVTS